MILLFCFDFELTYMSVCFNNLFCLDFILLSMKTYKKLSCGWIHRSCFYPNPRGAIASFVEAWPLACSILYWRLIDNSFSYEINSSKNNFVHFLLPKRFFYHFKT